MNELPRPCPDCGTPLPADSPQALCPACLMRQALASRTLDEAGSASSAPPPPWSPEEIADKFPGYEILECLGRGGMGVVYQARQKSLDRLVAIKILPPERVGEERFSERFAVEAATLAKLSHPNIVTVHDFGETGGLFYIVMEYVDGVNLRDLLREGKLEPQQALAIVPPVCDALQYAHDKGIVHRDIKPENLLLDKDGRIKIADFGIAKLIDPVAVASDRRTSPDESQRRSQTAATVMAGTQGYSAPEQFTGTADHRADIYALGVVLYEMLTGERPHKDLVAPSKKVLLDVRIDEMVLRALEKEPERRYQTAGEFRTVVETIGSTPGPSESPAHPLKSAECLYATPEFHRTVWGALKIHQGMGSLHLYRDRLEFQAGLLRTVIPLKSVRRLDLIRYPFFQSPAGLRSIEVEFDDGNGLRRLVLTPSKGMFSFVGTTNGRVREWFGAIREAIATAAGNPPPGSSTPTPYQGFSGEGTLLAACVTLGSFAVLLAVLTFLALTGSWRNLLPLAIPFIFGVSFVLALAWGQRRQWLREHATDPGPSPATKSSPPGAQAFTVIAVVAMLGLTATGNAMAMMIGAGILLLAGLLWFARGNVRIALLVALASLGVAGGVALMLNSKQGGKDASIDIAAESAAWGFGPVVERRLSMDQSLSKCFLDIESGRILSAPEQLVEDLRKGGRLSNGTTPLMNVADWARTSGADFVLMPRQQGFDLDLLEGHAIGSETPFENCAASSVIQYANEIERAIMPSVEPGFHMSSSPGVGINCWIFRTREGSAGVLKIIDDTGNAKRVTVRYKLARTKGVVRTIDDISEEELNKATATFDFIEKFGGAFDAAFSTRDLHAAIDATRRLKRNLSDFNASVRGTECEFSPDLFTSLTELEQSLNGGDWDEIRKASAHNEKFSRDFRRIAAVMAKFSRKPSKSSAELSPETEADPRTDKILLEDLALHLIVAIREKDDAKLKALASDRIKGWPEALPGFAVELREHMRQFTGNDKFDLRAGESLVDGDFAAVRCTGPAELDDKCLVLFFVKHADGWRNHSLCNSATSTPLARLLDDLKEKSATTK